MPSTFWLSGGCRNLCSHNQYGQLLILYGLLHCGLTASPFLCFTYPFSLFCFLASLPVFPSPAHIVLTDRGRGGGGGGERERERERERVCVCVTGSEEREREREGGGGGAEKRGGRQEGTKIV